MRAKTPRFLFLIGLLAALLGAGTLLPAQEKAPGPAASSPAAPPLRVFVDGSMAGGDYLKTEITFVSYVRDRKDADVHIITTSLSSGPGTEYSIEWIGLGAFADLHYTLKCFIDRFATYDETRASLVRLLKKGLMPFVSRTGLSDQVKIAYTEAPAPAAAAAVDPWDSWIFNLSLGGSLNGESSYGYQSYRGGFSAGRTTEKLKLGVSWSGSSSRTRYTIEGEEEDYITNVKSWSSRGWAIWSLGDHWSAGMAASASSSTYSNVKTSFSFSPAVEFDVFPYSESTRKQLTILYRVTFGRYRYLEETIYDKTSENLWSQSLTVFLEATQPWGEAYASIVGSHYFHDASRNRLSVDGYISVRIWKGLSVYASGSYSLIHDQLSLVKGTLSKDEILLRLKQLSTTYDYYLSMGISYSFGSKLSRAVNPRIQAITYD